MYKKDWKNIGKVTLKRGKETIEEYDNLDQYVYWDYKKYDLVEGSIKWVEETLTEDEPERYDWWWKPKKTWLTYHFSYYLVDEMNLVIPLGVIESRYSFWKPFIKEKKSKWARPVVEYRKDPVPGTRGYGGCSNRGHKMKPYNSRRSGGRVKQKRVDYEY